MELHGASQALDAAEQQRWRAFAELVATLALRKGQSIRQNARSLIRFECRFQYQRTFSIATRCARAVYGGDTEMARAGVEKTCKERPRIEAWKAQPVDGTFSADKRRRPTI